MYIMTPFNILYLCIIYTCITHSHIHTEMDTEGVFGNVSQKL